MKLNELKISGSKCFKEETVIQFNELTCFVGTNGVGKTAALEALGKLFGDTQDLRRITYSDFYADANEDISKISKKHIIISATFCYPELDKTDTPHDIIPVLFRNMSYKKEDGKLYTTIELTSVWEKNSTSDGEITTEFNWCIGDEKNKLSAIDKGLIRLYYIPAVRNPEKQIKIIAGTVFKNILDLIDWGDDLRLKVTEQSQNLINTIESSEGIKSIENELTSYWKDFTSAEHYSELKIHPSETDFEQVIRNMVIRLNSNQNEQISIEEISDGNKSLFYLTLLSTFFSLKEKLKQQTILNGFKKIEINDNCFTIFALEEPENHLAPHYLGKILSVFTKLNSDKSQTIISSHSPCILKRINPEMIRYFGKFNNIVNVKKLSLPKITKTENNDTEINNEIIEFKYIKEAVQSHPELYFSKLVILGEGDSEEYLIPKLAKLYGIDLDTNFISFIPLSGRFTNHFWRLLNSLEIPYITLLDFDLGRNTGGEEKIKYVINQLKEINNLTEEEEKYLCDKTISFEERILTLNKKNIFFSYPLDIDYLMLQNYFNEYTSNQEILGAPRFHKEDNPNITKYNKGAIGEVLKKDIDEFEIDNLPKELDIKNNIITCYWYRHLFLGKGKPVTHKIAFNKVEASIKKNKTIRVFNELFDCIKGFINAK